MLGNDVVDLAHHGTQPGAQHPRFDARVFSERERALIAGNPSQPLRWVLWAAKEAAYKAAKKLDRAMVWAPARFEVELDSRLGGCVRHGERAFLLRVEQTSAYVHVLAQDSAALAALRSAASDALHSAASNALHCGVAEHASPDASAEARAFACRTLAARLGISEARLAVAKNGRIPVLCADGALASADLSLSHHGRFVAFACELAPGALAARLAS